MAFAKVDQRTPKLLAGAGGEFALAILAEQFLDLAAAFASVDRVAAMAFIDDLDRRGAGYLGTFLAEHPTRDARDATIAAAAFLQSLSQEVAVRIRAQRN